MQAIALIVLSILFVGISVIVPSTGFEERQRAYCEKVALWDSQINTPEHQRYGHPNYRGVKCKKEEQAKD